MNIFAASHRKSKFVFIFTSIIIPYDCELDTRFDPGHADSGYRTALVNNRAVDARIKNKNTQFFVYAVSLSSLGLWIKVTVNDHVDRYFIYCNVNLF